jgi:hypothetical protein
MRTESYEHFKQEWSKLKEEYHKKGVTSFSGFVVCRLNELMEQEKKKCNP